METWEIKPLAGVDGLRFGMTYAEVVQILGEPSQKRASPSATVGYWPHGVSVHFNPDAEFIEIARGMSLSPVIFGVHVFSTPADDLVRTLTDSGHGFDPDTEKGHTFAFRDIQIGLWRAYVPEHEEDTEGRVFDSVGVGRAGYYV